jgi:hypothetical protein
MKKLALVGFAAVALAVPAAGQASGTTKACGNLNANVGNIRATGTTCKTAKKVVKANQAGKKYGSYKCTSKPYQGGANVVCKSGKKRVRYQIAD